MNEVQRVDGKNTFKWKIGNLMRREWLKSPDFEMNGFRFSLFSTSFLPKTVTEGTCWGFWIIPVDGSIFLLRYTLIFVDDKGQDFVATNGTVKGNLRHQALLGFFKEDYLKKYNIIENGIITLRITIELDSNERKEQELLPTDTTVSFQPQAMNEVRQMGSKKTYEWKIGNLSGKREYNSPAFQVDEQDFCFFFTSFSKNNFTETFWGFWLFPEDSSIYMLHYTLSFMDDKGKDLLATKGIVKGNTWHQSLLGFFLEDYFKTNNFIKSGTLTLRINFEPNADEKKEPELRPTAGNSVEPPLPASALEQATQTEASCPWLMRNITTNTETEQTTLLESLSEDLGSFYDNKTNTDCVLKVGKSQFPVHRAVLSARSVVFAAMFNHDTKEKLHGEVDIPDVDPTVLSDVLYYIYSGKIRGLTPDTAVSMYTVADKYALCRLRDVCLDVLLNSLTTENICDAAVLAHMHGETALEKKVIYFIAERVEEFMESDNWRQFAQDRCLLANKLLCSALVTSKKKNIE